MKKTNKTNSKKVTLTLGQLKQLIKESLEQEASSFSRDSVRDGNAEIEAALEKLRESGQSIEQVERAEKLLKKFTVTALQSSEKAKHDQKAANAAVKTDCKPLEDAAKQLGDLIGGHEPLFISVQEHQRKLGVLLTRKRPVISQADSGKAIYQRLADPDWLAKHQEVQKLGAEMRIILEAAEKKFKELGLFDKEPEKTTWDATFYSQDDETGEMDQFKESKVGDFFAKIGAGLRKVGAWLLQKFLPAYERKEVNYIESLDAYDQSLQEMIAELEG